MRDDGTDVGQDRTVYCTLTNNGTNQRADQFTDSTNLTYRYDDGRWRLELGLSEGVSQSVFTLDNPPRVVVDLRPAHRDRRVKLPATTRRPPADFFTGNCSEVIKKWIVTSRWNSCA